MMLSNSTKIVICIIGVLFCVSIIYLQHLYACLTIAFILAYLLDPIVAKLEQWKISRNWGALLTLLIFFIVLVFAGIIVVPKVIAQAQILFQRLPMVYEKVIEILTPMSEKYFGYNLFQDFNDTFLRMEDPKSLVKPLGNIAHTLFSTTVRMVSTVLGLLIIPLLAFHLLRTYPELDNKISSLLPIRYHRLFEEIRGRLDVVLGGFIRGQLVVSTILTFYYSIAFTILDLDLALVLGFLAGFLNVIPYLGILSACILTLFVALVQGATLGVFIAIGVIFTIGMVVEGSILTPKVVGSKVGLSPLTLIIALLAGGELLGLIGMLLAIPLAAFSKVFLDYFLDHYRKSENFNRV